MDKKLKTLSRFFVRGQRGFSLTEVIVAAGVVSIGSYFISDLISKNYKVMSSVSGEMRLIEVRQEVIALATNAKAWEKTIAGNTSSCLPAGTCANGSTGKLKLFDFNNQLVYDSDPDPIRFTREILPCGTLPVAACPVTMDLRWTTRCEAGSADCKTPETFVSITFNIPPDLGMTNTARFNSANIRVKNNQFVSPTIQCSKIGRIYVGPNVASAFTFVRLDVDANGCAVVAALKGMPGRQGPKGPKGATGAAGQPGNIGPPGYVASHPVFWDWYDFPHPTPPPDWFQNAPAHVPDGPVPVGIVRYCNGKTGAALYLCMNLDVSQMATDPLMVAGASAMGPGASFAAAHAARYGVNEGRRIDATFKADVVAAWSASAATLRLPNNVITSQTAIAPTGATSTLTAPLDPTTQFDALGLLVPPSDPAIP